MKTESPRQANGEGSVDHADDHEPYTTSIVRLQFLLRRGVPPEWAATLVPLAFGEARP